MWAWVIGIGLLVVLLAGAAAVCLSAGVLAEELLRWWGCDGEHRRRPGERCEAGTCVTCEGGVEREGPLPAPAGRRLP